MQQRASSDQNSPKQSEQNPEENVCLSDRGEETGEGTSAQAEADSSQSQSGTNLLQRQQRGEVSDLKESRHKQNLLKLKLEVRSDPEIEEGP